MFLSLIALLWYTYCMKVALTVHAIYVWLVGTGFQNIHFKETTLIENYGTFLH
jgi:hypothetical protein